MVGSPRGAYYQRNRQAYSDRKRRTYDARANRAQMERQKAALAEADFAFENVPRVMELVEKHSKAMRLNGEGR